MKHVVASTTVRRHQRRHIYPAFMCDLTNHVKPVCVGSIDSSVNVHGPSTIRLHADKVIGWLAVRAGLLVDYKIILNGSSTAAKTHTLLNIPLGMALERQTRKLIS